ncbi:MAG: ABC transporter ATP-binding protein/permease [Mycobacteriaceae bacterium]|nr:ABC transporter ATP-binding protein/permease [Mycobacteriaceae bacterium]
MLLALLRQYVRPYRGLVAALMVLQFISTLALLYLPTVNAAIIDDGITQGDVATIVKLGGVMLAVTSVQALCAVGAIYFGSRTGLGVGRDLRSSIFHHITSFSEQETARFGTASLLTRTTSDVRQIQFLVQISATVLAAAPLMCVGGTAMALRLDTGLSWLLLVSIPVLAVSNCWIVAHLLPLFRRMQNLIDTVNQVIREQLWGTRVIRAFTRESLERDRFARANVALSDITLTAAQWQALMLPLSTLIINLSSVALVWFGGLRIDRGQMQVGALVAFLSYFAQILAAVLLATTMLMVLPRASVCAQRICEVLSTQPTVRSPANPTFPLPAPLPGRLGAVQLVAATFRYPGADRSVLQSISLTARPGTSTAVVGSTGSGKSTLLSLICRFYDVTDGAVLVDDIDVRDYDLERLWSTIGLVPQRGYLFSGTVADNLRYGATPHQVITDEQLWEALRVAAADEFVRAHREGLHMRIAQGGNNLSGGQRQRLAIARTVIRQPTIYLFDDSFSALDVHTEARVRTALRESCAEATMLIVTQRISTAVQADRIAVLDDGKIIGLGTHESLLADCPIYTQFARSQSWGPGRTGDRADLRWSAP